MSLTYAPKFRRRHAPSYARVPESKTMCSLFIHCEGCPYPSHGFICWSSDGLCMREIMKRLNEGVDTDGDKCGTE